MTLHSMTLQAYVFWPSLLRKKRKKSKKQNTKCWELDFLKFCKEREKGRERKIETEKERES